MHRPSAIKIEHQPLQSVLSALSPLANSMSSATSQIDSELAELLESQLPSPQIEVLTRYDTLSQISGNVYLARHVATLQLVAIKRFPKSAVKELVNEVQNHGQLMHPNIICLLEVVETPNSVDVVLERGEQDLYAYLQSNVLTEVQVLDMFAQLCAGVSYCHSMGIVHRDIKVDNVVLKNGQLKLIDFGFSAFVQGPMIDYVGSLEYLSPQIVARQPYDGVLADIWACGVCMYIMLTKRFPFANAKQIVVGKFSDPKCSESTRQLLSGMLQVNDRISMASIRSKLPPTDETLNSEDVSQQLKDIGYDQQDIQRPSEVFASQFLLRAQLSKTIQLSQTPRLLPM